MTSRTLPAPFQYRGDQIVPNRRVLFALALALPLAALPGQDRLKEMPGYARYTEMAPKLGRAMISGAVSTAWAEDSKSFEYTRDGKRWHFDVASRQTTEVAMPEATSRPGFGRMGGVARGRQAVEAISPDSSRRAFYRDRNLWVSDADSSNERQITTDGSAEKRVKYGTASWVYGEELSQNTAMWWSPDGSKIAYYRFDESPVRDYYLQTGQSTVEGSVEIEAYPKAGADNPIVDLFVYDLASGTFRQL
ncbi:MAG TPA: DPP IV N-terminal domain-containing protein, partial [Gemmatimonadales bacterium]|nr:DPP IV N-terminal domain-containing protein [Gemmatimonadales bacterium]